MSLTIWYPWDPSKRKPFRTSECFKLKYGPFHHAFGDVPAEAIFPITFNSPFLLDLLLRFERDARPSLSSLPSTVSMSQLPPHLRGMGLTPKNLVYIFEEVLKGTSIRLAFGEPILRFVRCYAGVEEGDDVETANEKYLETWTTAVDWTDLGEVRELVEFQIMLRLLNSYIHHLADVWGDAMAGDSIKSSEPSPEQTNLLRFAQPASPQYQKTVARSHRSSSSRRTRDSEEYR